MRFLALTAFQAALLAVVVTTAIVLLYFLKHRHRRVIISSALLWSRIIEKRRENSIFEKLRQIVSILIAVTIALLIALAVARPEIEFLTGGPRRTVIVLDTSPSMLARTSDGRTRWQHAVELAETLVNEASPATEFRIVDTSERFDMPATLDRNDVRRSLAQVSPAGLPTHFPSIDAVPAGVESQVILISDGVSRLAVPADVTTLSVFEEAPNVGITAFEIRSTPTSPLAYEAFLEIYNSGDEARTVEVVVSGAGQQRITRTVPLQPDESLREALDLSEFDGGGVRAAVRTDGDAFSPDDVAFAYLPVKRRAKVLLVTAGNNLLQTVLSLHSQVELSVVSPAAYVRSDEFDAVVLDRFAPAVRPVRPTFIIGVPRAPWLKTPLANASNPVFDSWQEDHPVMQRVSLYDVSVRNATRIDPEGLQVLAATANRVPLIVASERPRWIQLTFDLQATDFPYHAAFPLFIDNVLNWFDHERLALRRAPGTVEVPIADAEVRTIDGSPLPSLNQLGTTVFEASEPGLYVATQGDTRQYVAVNFANRQYSDINNSGATTGRRTEVAAPLLRHELYFYMLFAASILIAAEWFTYHRRLTL